MKIRKATIPDVKAIRQFVNQFAKKEEMLPLSLKELYEDLRDYIVYDDSGVIKGSCALHIWWEDIAEIRSLAVKEEYQRQAVGKSLVKKCLADAKELGIKKVFALTYRPEFFGKLGFKEINRDKLPQMIWEDCRKCHKFPECDEYAVIITLKG